VGEGSRSERPALEYRLTAGDAWSRKVLLALLRRYDLKPYRYRNQRKPSTSDV